MLALGVFILIVSLVVSLIGTIMFCVAAFRVSVAWGLMVLFVPFAALVFLVKYWPEAKRGFLVGLAGSAAAGIGAFMLTAGVASKAKEEFGTLAAQMQAEMARQQANLPQGAPSTAAPARFEIPTSAPASAPREEPRTPISGTAVAPRLLLPELPEIGDPGEVSLADIQRHVGKYLEFFDQDGVTLRGKLVAANAQSLTIERDMHGGSVQYDLPRARVREIRLAE